MLTRLFRGARALVQKEKLEREMNEELRFHLDMEIQKNIERGMGPSDARLKALRTFGGVERIKEEVREARGGRLLETLAQDVRYGLRTLAKNRGYAAVVILTLGLGIGANTAIFSVVHGVLLRPLPYERGDELVVVRQQAPAAGVDDMGFSVKDIADYRERNQTLAGLVEYHDMWFNLLGRGEPRRVQTGVVSANFFGVLGVKPVFGRTFRAEDEQPGAEAVLVLSHGYWQRSFGGDPAVVGQHFDMNDRVHTVVGILPPVPQYPVENDVYMPTSACPFRSNPRLIENRNGRMMSAFARLKPGVAPE